MGCGFKFLFRINLWSYKRLDLEESDCLWYMSFVSDSVKIKLEGY